MAIIQVPRTPGLGELFGAGISSGLQNILDMKLQSIAQREQRRGTASALQSLGYSPEEATTLSALEPQILQTIVKERMQAPSQRLFEQALAGTTPGLQAQLGVTPGVFPEEVPVPTQAVLPQQAESPPVAKMVEPLADIAKAPVQIPEEAVSEKVDTLKPEAIPIQQQPEFPTAIPSTERQLQPIGKISPITRQISKIGDDISRMRSAIASGALKPRQTDQIAKMMSKKEAALSNLLISEEKAKREERKFDARQKLEEKKFKFEEKKFEKQLSTQERKEKREDQKTIDKETLPVYEKITKEAKAAQENDMRLDRIQELNEKGNLGFTVFNSLLGTVEKGIFGFGLNLDFLMTADAQELKKLSSDFLKNVKDIFGARVTQQEVQMFLKTVPTLYQSKEGRKRVIDNLRAFNRVSRLRLDAMNDIIEENNGRRPRNLNSIIEKRISKQKDAIAEAFKSAPTRKYRAILPFLGI